MLQKSKKSIFHQASYCSFIFNYRSWEAAGKLVLPTQSILQEHSSQFKLLIKATTTSQGDLLNHVVFSPGYKDRIGYTKCRSN